MPEILLTLALLFMVNVLCPGQTIVIPLNEVNSSETGTILQSLPSLTHGEYEGEFSRDKKTVTGIWRFKKKVLVWQGVIPYWVFPAPGSFSMRKKE